MSRNAAALEGHLSNYYKWNLEVFPIEKNKRILDLGCGSGIYLDEIMRYSPACYVGVDYSERNIDQIKKKFIYGTNCSAHCLSLTERWQLKALTGSLFDYVLCFDVIEHIENDKEALIGINELMHATKAEFLFLKVPALQSIYGKNDEAIGHYRRYSLHGLSKLLTDGSFSIKKIRYQNMLGIFPWYIKGSLLKRRQALTCNEGRLFNSLVPIVSAVEKLLSPPIGLSLYSICSVS
ncbi:MAG: class I SAM-dependent methyltransferase [Thermodesulfobacteriota bacterium]|jgi:cyclopropane fatty-acyl-phospholipid synthase-like methyltransferase